MKNELSKIDMDETSAYRTIPVTLRQVEALKSIPLNGNFGIDDTEHDGLLDDDTLLRLRFGVEMNGVDISHKIYLESFEAHLPELSNAKWFDCIDYPVYTSGSKTSNEFHQIQNCLWTLLSKIVPDYDDLIEEMEKPFDECIEETL